MKTLGLLGDENFYAYVQHFHSPEIVSMLLVCLRIETLIKLLTD